MFLQSSPSDPATTQPAASMTQVLDQFVANIVAALPRLLSGLLFLILAYLAIKIVLRIVRVFFDRMYPADEQLIVDLSVTIVALFLWFGVALGLLTIVGLGQVAASLGTAGGFIGLGVAFALKEMIADTVAGVYLLRDADFNEGDHVDTASVSGTVTRIDLRKTRIQSEDGNLVVLPNRDVEKKWVQRGAGGSNGASE